MRPNIFQGIAASHATPGFAIPVSRRRGRGGQKAKDKTRHAKSIGVHLKRTQILVVACTSGLLLSCSCSSPPWDDALRLKSRSRLIA